jgi:hypothetical protein
VGSAQLASIKQSIANELTAKAAVQSETGFYTEYIRKLNEINKELS